MRRNPTARLVLLTLAACAATTACSRLAFIRPDLGRGDFEQTALDVEVREPRRGEAQARQLVLHAQQALLSGQTADAERVAREAVRLDDQLADAHTVLAAALDAQAKPAPAGRHYRRAAELSPQRGGPLNNYGAWLCRNGKPAEALGWFDRALADRDYATPAAALANAGFCADRAGDHARAERDLRRAIELDPQNALALGTLAEREYRAGRYLQARAFSERRLAVAPADRAALQLASQIEHALGDNAAAQQYVQRMGEESPQPRDSKQGAKNRP
ncbi:MAG TPA: tetratricopeptide repeat protein [Lysobacter sp.]|nr:tetratricopeptide repeat protein [Lysobacter sp.]